eukprot:TRINITY_DN509_c0_g1_i2.p1 TRINITY_DN509_c0_g1~~TRINITY_DN509_c0_g1_i2.p1  ORF type:complete len:161 (-),score=72.35 TRINITY_DN509_c0_g1_i2:190-612(-)
MNSTAIAALLALLVIALASHASALEMEMSEYGMPQIPRLDKDEEYLAAIEEESPKLWEKRQECLQEFEEASLDFKECWESRCAEKFAGRVAEKQIKDRRERKIPQETFPGLEKKYLQCVLSKAMAKKKRDAMRAHYKIDL